MARASARTRPQERHKIPRQRSHASDIPNDRQNESGNRHRTPTAAPDAPPRKIKPPGAHRDRLPVIHLLHGRKNLSKGAITVRLIRRGAVLPAAVLFDESKAMCEGFTWQL